MTLPTRLRLLPIATLLLTPSAFGAEPEVPAWAQPGSATHVQVPPPKDFHRETTTWHDPIGIFDGQSEIGSALVAGHASHDAATGRYTLAAAGYNIWYTRDEFRFLWKEMSGDVSLAADVIFPNPQGYDDRKVVLIFRQDLDDDAKEMMVGLHGVGMAHLAQRPAKAMEIKEEARVWARPKGFDTSKAPTRVGIEKRGDRFTFYVSEEGGPLKQVGEPAEMALKEPFYVGVGFTSHLPVTLDSAILSEVVLENEAGRVK